MKLKGRDGIMTPEHKDGDLVFLGIYTSKRCNLKCLYCFEDAGKESDNETTLEEKISMIEQGIEMGAKVLFIAGAGEPTIDSQFRSVVEHSYKRGLTTLVYTNGTIIDSGLAQFMFGHDVTPVVKIESLHEDIHDELVGRKWGYQRAMQGINSLLAAGYGDVRDEFTRIGIAAVYTRLNMHGLLDLKEWCEQISIKLMVDWMLIRGRAGDSEDLLKPTAAEIIQVGERFGEESAGDILQGNCIFWRYGITIDQAGYARPCTGFPTKLIGNIRKSSLEELNRIKNERFPKRCGLYTCFFKDEAYRK
ncbi:radical SAM protein [Nanoarchaeota archaeon]